MIAPTLSNARATAITVGIAGHETMSSSAPFCTTSHESNTPTRMSGAMRRSATASNRSSRTELLLFHPRRPGLERLEHRLGADGDEDERPRVPPGEPHPVMDDAQEPGTHQDQHDALGQVPLRNPGHDLAQADDHHQQRPPQSERSDLDEAQMVEHQHGTGDDHEQPDRDTAAGVAPSILLHRLPPFPGPAPWPATHGNLRTIPPPGAGFPAGGGPAPVNGGGGDAGGGRTTQPSGDRGPSGRTRPGRTRPRPARAAPGAP